eukprot:NODE_160_length_15021_cov_0.894786.p4 type:complete len:509 gc:universal NODE_160_length_15021_cov_0.894786:6132-4606(-)
MLILYLVICGFLSNLDHWFTVGMGRPHSSTFYPAIEMKEKPKHPVLLIPGMLTSQLDSWSIIKNSCETKSGRYFRTPIWSKFSGVLKWIMNGQCVLDFLDLDENETDAPKGYKIRAGSSYESIDYFVGGYAVWAHLIANLATIGYDPNTMGLIPFDWRLSFKRMEERDSTFTKMKFEIENMVRKTKEKAVVISHSMGGNINLYFMQWVTQNDPLWMERNIHAWVSNGTPFLGNIRAVSAVVSGYVKETSSNIMKMWMDNVMDVDNRQVVMSHLRCYYQVFPMGGNKIWGNKTFNPMKESPYTKFQEEAGGQLMTLFEDGFPVDAITADDLQGRFLDFLDPYMQKFARSLDLKGESLSNNETSWPNPLSTKLPIGNYTIYCTYGYDIKTDYSYSMTKTASGKRYDIETKTKKMGYLDGSNTAYGDETVPLNSLAYPCISTWKNIKHNPSNVNVVTKEYQSIKDYSSSHVELLHHPHFLRDVIKIVSGGTIKQEIHSNITKIVENIDKYK